MDIQRLRQILNELNPIFWNPEIDRQLEASDYPNQSPIESAKYRHTIALRKLVPRSHHYRKSLENKRFNKLLEKVDECLSPYDTVFEVLLEEFTSPFAKQVLLTHQNLIEEFAGITSDNYQSWTELLVCMSHKDFWVDLAEEPAETEQNTTLAKKEKDKSKTIGSVNIQNFHGILGDVQAENVQTGNHASIHKETKAGEQNKSLLIRLLQLLGWLWTQLKWLWANVWPK